MQTKKEILGKDPSFRVADPCWRAADPDPTFAKQKLDPDSQLWRCITEKIYVKSSFVIM